MNTALSTQAWTHYGLDSEQDRYYEGRHRANVEYLMMLQHHDQQDIQHILYDGFKHSIEQQVSLGDITRQGFNQLEAVLNDASDMISSGFGRVAEQLASQTQMYDRTNALLQEMLEALTSPQAVEAAESARQAARNMEQAGQVMAARAPRLLEEALELLEQSLATNDYDPKAHFDYAFLCRNYRKNLSKAREHFDTAAVRAMTNDRQFAVFALRNLAEVNAELGDHTAALSALREARSLDDSDELRFECIPGLIETDGEDEAARELECLIEIDQLYYPRAIAVESLMSCDETARVLRDAVATKLAQCDNSLDDVLREFDSKCGFVLADERSGFSVCVETSKRDARKLPFTEIDVYVESKVGEAQRSISALVAAEEQRVADEKHRQLAERERRRRAQEQLINERRRALERRDERRLAIIRGIGWTILAAAACGLLVVVARMYFIGATLITDRQAEDALNPYGALIASLTFAAISIAAFCMAWQRVDDGLLSKAFCGCLCAFLPGFPTVIFLEQGLVRPFQAFFESGASSLFLF